VRRALITLAAAGCALGLLAAPAAARKPNPCLDAAKRQRLLCPDFTMTPPYDLSLDWSAKPGRVVLRAGNSIDSVGLGPAELHGVRIRPRLMRGRQRIYRRGGGRIGIDTGAHLFYKHIPGQTHYWKFRFAARFELRRIDRRGRRGPMVRRGPKISYCLRDLDRSRPRLPRSPAEMVYPSCDTARSAKRATIGTSVGWSDVYPASYHEQWIDVTGLRGCFDLIHTADPRDGVYESNERNNSGAVRIRLPFSPGPQMCPRRRAAKPRPRPRPSPGYSY
jgi:hypothetical protein